MLETLKGFKEDIKTDNKKSDISTENSFNINLNIDKFVNERKQDINQIADEIAYMISRKALV